MQCVLFIFISFYHIVYVYMLVSAQVCKVGIVHSMRLEGLQAPTLSRPCKYHRTAAAMQYLNTPGLATIL